MNRVTRRLYFSFHSSVCVVAWSLVFVTSTKPELVSRVLRPALLKLQGPSKGTRDIFGNAGYVGVTGYGRQEAV